MDNSIVQFEPNVPVEVALKFPDGMQVQSRYGGQRVMYTLEDGRKMFVDPEVAASIRAGEYKPGERFTITKLVNGSRVRWDVNPMQRPAISARGTGTNGPAPQAAPVPQRQTTPPTKVPANVAFGEIVSFVNNQLKACGEQWNDEARQAAVCTMFIEAGKQGWLAPWERPQ